MHMLDRPVWASLTTQHAPLSEGNELARRFVPDVNLFASASDDSPAALAALSSLVKPGESVFLLQVPDIVMPPGLVEVKVAKGVQMIAARTAPARDTPDWGTGSRTSGNASSDKGIPASPGRVAARRGTVNRDTAASDIVELGDEDAPEMLALATLTEPGPFLTRTHRMGNFIGIRLEGRLAAMAGERMRFPGYTEVSGVCTHPDFRGRGLARRLSAAVMAAIVARGEQPFLHAWRSNQAAISLYESLGFELRTEVNVAVLTKP